MELNQTARSAALARLEPLVGEWATEASIAPGLHGSAVFEWMLDGQFLVQHSTIPHPAAPDGYSIIGVDEAGEVYTQHYFDSRGVARLYAMTFDGRDWELLRTSPDFFPLDFSQRYTGALSEDRNTIEGRWERSNDGSTWELDFGLTYRRVR
jgi:hypothetical protein